MFIVIIIVIIIITIVIIIIIITILVLQIIYDMQYAYVCPPVSAACPHLAHFHKPVLILDVRNLSSACPSIVFENGADTHGKWYNVI